MDQKSVLPGYPKLIKDVWGISGPIDAAFTRINCQGKTYIFKVAARRHQLATLIVLWFLMFVLIKTFIRETSTGGLKRASWRTIIHGTSALALTRFLTMWMQRSPFLLTATTEKRKFTSSKVFPELIVVSLTFSSVLKVIRSFLDA